MGHAKATQSIVDYVLSIIVSVVGLGVSILVTYESFHEYVPILKHWFVLGKWIAITYLLSLIAANAYRIYTAKNR